MQSGDATHISQRLEVGRKYLEQLADIALQIEHARVGLTNSSYLSANPDEVPTALKRLWEFLEKDIAALPERELVNELIDLERMLADRLKSIMPVVDRLCATDDGGEEVQISGVRTQLQELSRMSTTALAMRLLAHRRRFKVPFTQLPISADTLLERAQRVKQVERKHKLRVITHMKDMVTATTSMLSAPGIDAAMRTMLKGVLRDLQLNARHLATGGSFATLPIPIEHVEVGEEDHEESVVEAPPPRAAEPAMTRTQAPPLPPPTPTPTPTPREHVATHRLDLTQTTPVGHFFRHVGAWLRAPMGVTWSEAGKMADAAEKKTAAHRSDSGSGGESRKAVR
jgi:hypothetical protein